MGTRFLLVISLFCLLFCASCSTTNKIAYFQNAQDTTYKRMLVSVEAPLQKNDFISIAISSANAAASEIFNPIAGNAENTATASGANDIRYYNAVIKRNGEIYRQIRDMNGLYGELGVILKRK